ncbi:hypothetical protein D3C72_648270 [compost metagenome]
MRRVAAPSRPSAPPTPTKDTSAPLNLYDTPSVVPPYGMTRPAPLTDVTLPGNKLRRCVPICSLKSPSVIAPSGARNTPPCSTVAAAKRKEPNAE